MVAYFVRLFVKVVVQTTYYDINAHHEWPY